MTLKHVIYGLILALPIAATSAQAATDNGSLSVQVTVQASCSLTGGSIDFGTYTSGQQTDLEAEGSISYANCPVGNLTFELGGGQSSDTSNRYMSSGNDQLKYQLYRNTARSSVWGEGSDGQVVQRLSIGGGAVSIYGTIMADQSAPAGSFTDTIAMTMTF